MPDLRDEFEALMPEPAVRCGEYAGPPGEGASENYYDADQLRAAMQSVAERAAKKEREECAKIADAKAIRINSQWIAHDIAAAIRAREGKGGAG